MTYPKLLIFAVFLLLSITTLGQSKEKIHICNNGDTLRRGDKVLIKRDQTITFIYPSSSTQTSYREIYTDYLQREMPGQVYNISNIYKVKEGKKEFRTIAVIKVGDKQLNKFQNVEFNINWEKAVEKGEVELNK